MHWRGRLCGVCLAVSLVANGCATLPQVDTAALPNTSLGEIESVPFFAQTSYQCGPAALAMVLNWAGASTTPQALADQLYIASRKGSLQIELIAAARQFGVLPYAHQGSLEELWQLLATETPVLVLQNLGFSWYPRWHYAVAVGFDAERQQLLLRSGGNRLRRESLAVFHSTWQHSDYWMLSLHQPGDIPRIAKEQPYLSAASGLEATGHPLAALRAYEAATRRWPDSMLAWLALGNAHYQAGAYAAAEHAYRQAKQLAPAHPAPPHNLAWSLIRRGMTREAEIHAGEALELSLALADGDRSQYASAALELGLIAAPPAMADPEPPLPK